MLPPHIITLPPYLNSGMSSYIFRTLAGGWKTSLLAHFFGFGSLAQTQSGRSCTFASCRSIALVSASTSSIFRSVTLILILSMILDIFASAFSADRVSWPASATSNVGEAGSASSMISWGV